LKIDPSPRAAASDEPSASTTAAPQAADSQSEHAFMKRFARGTSWAAINYVVSYSLRLGSNLVLWRLLYPDAFGLMAIVNAIITGLAMFSDIGIAQTVVQNDRGEEPDFLNTIWTLQVVRGLGMCALASLAAYPVARFYNQPQLTGLILVVASSVGISAFNSTSFFTASRRLAVKRLTLIDLGSQIANLAVIIVWSALTGSVWALAAGSVVTAAIRLVLGHVALPGARNRFHWNPAVVREVSHFGRWIFISTILTFLSSNSDRLIFGKLVSMDRLGVYGIAVVWATFPAYIISHLTSTVLFPLLSRLRGSDGSLPDSMTRLRVPILCAAGWLFSCLMAGGPALVQLLYDHRAVEAGPLIQLLACGYWVSSLESANGSVQLALGKPKGVAMGQLAKVVAMIVLLPIGAHYLDFWGTVLALSVTELARYVVSIKACNALGFRPLRLDLVATVGTALFSGVGLLVRQGYVRLSVHPASGRLDAFFEGLVIFLALSTVWLAAFLFVRRRAHSMRPAAPAPRIEVA
jgi:O-antigen/teichoic acid export membrane protein